MNYSRAFSYVFEDKNWLSKILIAGLISLIPIVGQFYILGWMVEIVRRVKAGRADILPTTHFSYFLTLGLKLFVVCLIYSIPVIILSCIVNLLGGTAEYSDGNFYAVIITSVGCFSGLLTFVVQVAVSLLTTYGTIKLAETDQIKACLDFNDAFHTIKDNIGTFIIVELLSIVVALIQFFGVILCFIGLIFTAPYGVAVTGHLVGQLWGNLKHEETRGKSFRGSVNEPADDTIEEAPFTKVNDIVVPAEPETVIETVKDAAEETVSAAEDIAENTVDEITESAKPETVIEAAKDAAEETVSAAEDVILMGEPAAAPETEPEAEEKPAEEEQKDPENDQENDLPSFE